MLSVLAPSQAIAAGGKGGDGNAFNGNSGAGGAGGTGDTGNPGDSGPFVGGGGGGGAGGGRGGDGGPGNGNAVDTGGAGGANGTVGSPGQPGQPGTSPNADSFGGAGGGGGGNGFVGTIVSIDPATTLSGGAGGAGGDGGTRGQQGSGGGGGAGGYGAVVTGGGASTNAGTIKGGRGGDGGGTRYRQAGGAGDGGTGISFDGAGATFTNTAGSVAGGAGGTGGRAIEAFLSTTIPGAAGGIGGAGVSMALGGTIVNAASITGGDGGAGGSGLGPQGQVILGASGAAGAGIVGAGITVIDSGIISAGQSGAVRGNAIVFSDGANFLNLQTGYSLIGNINLTAATSRVTLNQIGPLTLANTITGAGSVIDGSAGILTLAGANTHNGGTTIGAGHVLVANNSSITANTITSSSIGKGALTFAGGTLRAATDGLSFLNAAAVGSAGGVFDTNGNTLTWQGMIGNGTGTPVGTLSITGAGTAVLTGANTFTGPTTIDPNTALRLGNGGTSGSVGGDITDNGTLVFNRSDTFTIVGTISGNGSVQQIGAGTTILAGNNSYAGGTTIAAGTLQLGNGSTAGSIVGAVANSGTLSFDRSNALTFAGSISGSGGVSQIGNGVTTLSGTSTYTGVTTVQSGTLLITGALANTATTVGSGATLGGTGTIPAAVTVMPGGILSPGVADLNHGVGTLTVGSLNGESVVLNVDLGSPNAVNGTTSDLIRDGGNLTLSGQVNITDAGNFGPGAYRLIDYAGTLSGGSLNVGSVPAGYTAVIQTAIPGQINLVAVGPNGVTQFWDGGGPAGDGVIQGGNGTWNAANGNWTSPNGTSNVQWASSVGVFAGAAGTVTLGDAEAFQTLQFSSTGYQIAAVPGATLTPSGQAVLRADPGVTATIAAPLVGAGSVTKTDAGTIVLTGANVYTGGTTIATGTLQLGNGRTSGSIIGNVADNGTLAFDRSDTVTFSGTISGTGAVSQIGTGITVLTASNSYSGGTTIAAGTLSVSTDSNLGATSGGITFAGGILELTAPGFTTGRTVTLAPTGTVQVDGGTATLSGVVTDGASAGSLTKTGAGTLVLSGASTYSGGTTIAAGTLSVTADTNLGDANGRLTLAGGTLEISGAAFASLRPVALAASGTVQVDTGQATFSGVVSGAGELVKTGPGALILSGVGTYTGPTTITGGTLALAGNGSIAGSSNVTDNGVLDISGTSAGAAIKTLAGSGSVALGAQTLTLTAGSSAFSGSIGGSGGLSILGGSQTLSGMNAYTGATTIAGGTLALAGNGSIAGSSNVTDNGTFDIAGTSGGAAIKTLSGNGSVALGSQTLTVTSGSSAFAGSIGGSGGLTVFGGLQTLSGINGYTGTTTIAGGTLALSGNGSIAASSGVTDNGIVDISGTNAGAAIRTLAGNGGVALGGQTLTVTSGSTTFPGSIGGSGGFSVIGGLQTLSGMNAYTGATAISGGTLALAGNGSIAASSIVTDNGVFDIAATNAGAAIKTLAGSGRIVLGARTLIVTAGSTAFSGSIAGSGGLTLTGGTQTLSGANTYSGSTTVSGGALVAGSPTGFAPMSAFTVAAGASLDLSGNDETIGSLTGAGTVGNTGPKAATLTTGSDNTSTTFSGVIRDDGATSLTKVGTGTMTLSGVSTYTGATTVTGGTLLVTGSIANSVATVGLGATLGGGGTIGGLVVGNGATIAPGVATPFSTLRVGGPITFQSGSIYAVGIAANGSTDAITAGGTATLQGGTVKVTAANGVYDPAQRFTILTASGGVSGTFAGLTTTSNLAFLSPALSYAATSVQLGFVRNTVTFPSVGVTSNQRATGAAVQRLGAGNKVYKTVLGQTKANARRAFDALSGEVHASAVSAAFEDTRLAREAILDRLAEPYGSTVDVSPTAFSAVVSKDGVALPAPARPSIWTAWGQAFGDFGRLGGNSNAAGLDRSMGGLVAGMDVNPDNRFRLGFAGGYTNSTLTDNGRASSGTLQSAFGGVYGGAALSNWRIRGGALVGYNDYDVRRTVSFPGFNEKVRSTSGGYTAQGFAEVGYRIAFGRAAFEPFAGALAMHIDTDGFRESGGAAALIGKGRGYDYQATTLGLRADTSLSMFGALPLSAHGALAWQHVFGAVSPVSVLAFASAPGNTFTVTGAPIARDAAVAEAGLDWRIAANTTAGVFYSGSLAEKTYDNAVKGKLEVRF